MEKNLERTLDEILRNPGVTGVVCSDKQGLCLGVRGKASSKASGVIAAIADKAMLLEPTADAHPIISIQSDNGQCLIHRNDDITLGVYKTL